MSLFLFLIVSISGALSSDILNYTRAVEDPLGCSQNTTHTRYYYEIPSGSAIRLPTCRGAQSNSIVYWYSYSEYCRNSSIRNRHFASVLANGTSTCENRVGPPTLNECRANFRFAADSTIVLKNDERSLTAYICSLSRMPSSMDRPVSYFIRFRSKFDPLYSFVANVTHYSLDTTELVTSDNLSTSTVSIGSYTNDNISVILSTAGKFDWEKRATDV